MERIYLSPEKEGFYGAYYPHPDGEEACIIAMMGDAVDDRLAMAGVKWFQSRGVSVLAMSPGDHDYSHHNYPLERFGAAIDWLGGRGCRKFGVAGASTTGMLALLAASYYPDLTLTVAMSASDFVMEGFYKENGVERPGDGESTVSVEGQPLPYLPYAYRHPQYWEALRAEAKRGHNLIASREMFDESERLHPVQEEEKIRIENIHGRILVIGAEDDCLWDACRYMRRMQERIESRDHRGAWDYLSYSHGTHFVFPQGLLKNAMPVGSSLLVALAFREGRRHPILCWKTRKDIDRRVSQAIAKWKEE